MQKSMARNNSSTGFDLCLGLPSVACQSCAFFIFRAYPGFYASLVFYGNSQRGGALDEQALSKRSKKG